MRHFQYEGQDWQVSEVSWGTGKCVVAFVRLANSQTVGGTINKASLANASDDDLREALEEALKNKKDQM